MSKKLRIVIPQVVELTATRDDKGYLVLTLGDKKLATYKNEIVDSGALIGHLPNGQVALPLSSEDLPDIAQKLERVGIVRLDNDNKWGTYGGSRYIAAEILI